jgi:hypothetical protein
MSLTQVYATQLESPRDQSLRNAKQPSYLGGRNVMTRVELTHGDLLDLGVGQRHRGPVLLLAKLLWPRWLLRRAAAKSFGLFLLVSGTK